MCICRKRHGTFGFVQRFLTAWTKGNAHDVTAGSDHGRLERNRAGSRRAAGRGRARTDRLRENRNPAFPGTLIEVDLGDRAATDEALAAVLAAGPIDAVVNNVGLARFARIGSIELDDLFETYDLNVRTAVQVVQAALPGMRAAGWGRIVNVTSLTTLGSPERTPYAAAKAALETATRIWAGELASTGITVNAVAPGPTETEMYRERSPQGSERERHMLDTIPMGRVGKPREIAHAICALLDEDAGYLTGQIIRVDGGGSISAA